MAKPDVSEFLNRKFLPVTIEKSVTVSGGFWKNKEVVETMEIEGETGPMHFVHIHKNAIWLYKSTVGGAAQKGALKRSRIIAELKEKIILHTSAAEGSTLASVEAADPMDELEDVAKEPDVKKPRSGRKKAFEKILVFPMPAVAACAFPSCTLTRDIVLYPKGNEIWLHDKDLPWLIEYVALEVATGGVPVAVEAPRAAVAATNCATPGVHIRWDFQSGEAWEALILEGPHKGRKIFSKISSLSEEKWNAVRAKYAVFETGFAESTPAQRKTAVWHFLEMHCLGLMSA
jgi:hypothetical protein